MIKNNKDVDILGKFGNTLHNLNICCLGTFIPAIISLKIKCYVVTANVDGTNQQLYEYELRSYLLVDEDEGR